MPTLIQKPSVIQAEGNLPKKIEEFVGVVNTGNSRVSIAHMTAPEGWSEPGQKPDFDEYTVVLQGGLVVETENGTIDVNTGQAVECRKGEWVRYSTPAGAEYISVCIPAFSPETVHRDS
jgi:ethanolamine utilization protein EutQ (cupin superfamily)